MWGIIATSALAQSQTEDCRMKKVISLIAMVGMATTALAQEVGQWYWDRLYSRGQPTNICRAPLPGTAAFITFDCRDSNRTPILRIDVREAGRTGWAYGYRYEGQLNFRYRFHGTLFPSIAHWEFLVNNTWLPLAQLAAHPQPPANVPPPPRDGGLTVEQITQLRRVVEKQEKEEGTQVAEEAQQENEEDALVEQLMHPHP